MEVVTARSAEDTAHMAVSGGRTPGIMFRALATLPIQWSAVHIWQVDERVAPERSTERNLAGLRADLLSRIRIPPELVHPMPVEWPDLGAAAATYEERLRASSGGVLDVVLLGLGDDGHTASWPPHDPVVRRRDVDVAVVGPFHGVVRMTLTPIAVNRARHVLFLVTGRDKAQVVASLLGGNRVLPASRVRGEGTVLMAGGGAEAGAVAWSRP
jgi:6-phosphogluconolactonase